MNNLKGLKGLKNFLGNIPGIACETINNLLRLKKVVVYNPDDYEDELSVCEEEEEKNPTFPGIEELEKKLENTDKEKVDKSQKAVLFGIYVELINAIKTDPYYVIKLFMFGLDLSDSEIEGLFSTRLTDFPKFQYIRRIDNMISVFSHSLIYTPSFEDVEFIKAIRLPKSIENEYGGTEFIKKLESIDNNIIVSRKDCFTGRIQSFTYFFKSIYEITDKNEMIMTIISLPIRYQYLGDDEKKLSFFEEYMAPLFWYCLDILLYKYKKALIEQYVPNKDIQKYLFDEGFIKTTIGYDLRILNKSIKTIYGDVLYYKIEDEIYHREEKILEEIYLFCNLISKKTNISDEKLTSFCINMSPVYTKAQGDKYWNKSKDELPKDNSNFATFLLNDKEVIPDRMKFKPKKKEDNYKEKFAERRRERMILKAKAETERITKGIEAGIEAGRVRVSVKVKGGNKYGSCANSVRSVRSVRTLHRRRSYRRFASKHTAKPYAKKQKRSKRLKRSKRKSNKKIKKRAVSF